jgi:LPXTG-site transpeptidase (sortase) family protein
LKIKEIKFHILRLAEVTCWSLGILLSGAFVSQLVMGEVERAEGIARAEAAWSSVPPPVLVQPATALDLDVGSPDQSLWSESRIASWHESITNGPRPVLAVLDVPGIGLEVPVFHGEMDRGPVWIEGTARPGQDGNVGISGHRDGYFRALKDARVGDALTLRTPGSTERYVIDDIIIVDPIDVEVLDPTSERTITLVTCYPFYYLGSAPQRYIVRARLEETATVASTGTQGVVQ